MKNQKKYKELESNIFHAQLEISEIERKGKINEVYYELKLQLNILQNQIYTKKDKIMTAALNIDLVAHRENKLDSTPVSACDVAREVAYRNGDSAGEFGETPDAPWDFLYRYKRFFAQLSKGKKDWVQFHFTPKREILSIDGPWDSHQFMKDHKDLLFVGAKQLSISNYMAYPYRTMLAGYGFYPNGAPRGYLNTFHGFLVEALDPIHSTQKDRELFERFFKFKKVEEEGVFIRYDLDHIIGGHYFNIIANSNIQVFKYITSWYAWLYQKRRKNRVMPAFYSEDKQLGKGIATIDVHRKILGDMLYVPSAGMDDDCGYCGKFNGKFENRLLSVMDEMVFHGNRAFQEKFKQRMGNDIIDFQDKGKQPRTSNDPSMISGNTNDKMKLFCDKCGDARTVQIAVNEYYGKKHAEDGGYEDERLQYFDNLGESLENKNVIRMILHLFLTYDISTFNAQRDIPMTKLRKEALDQAGEHSIVQFIDDYRRWSPLATGLEQKTGPVQIKMDDDTGEAQEIDGIMPSLEINDKKLWLPASELFVLYREWCRKTHRFAHNGRSDKDFCKCSEFRQLINNKDIIGWRRSAAQYYKIEKMLTEQELNICGKEEEIPA